MAQATCTRRPSVAILTNLGTFPVCEDCVQIAELARHHPGYTTWEVLRGPPALKVLNELAQALSKPPPGPRS